MDNSNPGGDRWLMIQFVLMLLLGIVLVVLGLYLAVQRQEFTVLALGVLAVIVPSSIYAVMGQGAGGSGAADTRTQVELLRQIADRMLISDQAKRIAYRQKDRDALRQAIIDDIKTEDYGAAMALVNDMAEVYGYREEAEAFRQQILEAQSKSKQATIDAARAHLDDILQEHDWDKARRELDRLQRVYPDYPEIGQLSFRIAQSREKYKHDLTREFKEAYDREDHDRAANLLTEMDQYLTPDEAQPYIDMARQVLGQKRENMGVQYKMALQDKDFQRALSVGEQIVREFPNSQFASEVREMMQKLRTKATEQREAVT